MKKRLLAIAMTMALTAGLAAGCGSSTDSASTTDAASESTDDSAEAAGEKKVAYFVCGMNGGSAWGSAQQGFEDACAELGWEGYYVSPATSMNLGEMANLLETAITSKADAIIGTLYDQDVFGDAMKRAKEQGIYIATTNCYLTDEYEDFWVGTDPVGMGTSQGEYFLELMDENTEYTVVYMQTSASQTTQNQQFDAFCEVVKDYDNIHIFGQEYCDSNSTTASDKMASLVKANPEINAVVCADGYGCIGVGNFLDEQNLGDTFLAIGIDDEPAILNYITGGALDATVCQNFYDMGYQCIMKIKAEMDGETVEFNNDSGTRLVTPADVEAYAEEKGIEL